MKARRPKVSTKATQHTVLHQERRGDSPFFHECHTTWPVRGIGGPAAVVSRIMTGTHPRIDYGSTHPRIRERVERLRKRIEKGQHFAGGPLFASIPRIGTKGGRLSSPELVVVAQIWFALSTNGYRRVSRPSEPTRYISELAAPSLWQRYADAHREKSARKRARLLLSILAEVCDLCPDLPSAPGPRRKLDEAFTLILGARGAVGGGGERQGYLTARALSLALAAEVLGADVKHLRRRVRLHSPHDVSYG